MNCPKCTVSMTPRQATKIEVEECQTCCGVWLRAEEAAVQVAVSDDLRERFASVGKETELLCPSCDDAYLRCVDHDNEELEWCPECNGMYFDLGELPDDRAQQGVKARQKSRTERRGLFSIAIDVLSREQSRADGREVADALTDFLGSILTGD